MSSPNASRVVEVHVHRRDLERSASSATAAPGHLHLEVAATMPSFGCTRITSTFGRTRAASSPPNIRCGGVRNCTAISEHALRHALARAQIERHALPAPVVDVTARIAAYVGVDRVAGRRPAPRGSRARACRRRHPPRTARAPRRADRLRRAASGSTCSTFTFSSRTASADMLRRRLHRRERQQLQQVVLEHVANDARFLVVLAALLDADGLGRRDLHVRDALPVPERLEDRVREAEHEDVLNASPCRGSDRCDRPDARRTAPSTRCVQLRARVSRLRPNGFSMTTRAHGRSSACADARREPALREVPSRSARTRSAEWRDRTAGCAARLAAPRSISASSPCRSPRTSRLRRGRRTTYEAAAGTSRCHDLFVDAVDLVGLVERLAHRLAERRRRSCSSRADAEHARSPRRRDARAASW